jgi:predicted transcriptional regulator
MAKLPKTNKEVAPAPGEMEVLSVVYRQGESTARSIYEHFDKEVALASVQTHLRGLVRKGFLKHRMDDRTFVYQPSKRKKDFIRSLLRGLQKTLGIPSSELVSAVIDDESVDAEQLSELKTIVANIEESNANQ